MKIALSWWAETKNSDPNHPKALYRVYYPPYVIPKTVGCLTLKLLGYPDEGPRLRRPSQFILSSRWLGLDTPRRRSDGRRSEFLLLVGVGKTPARRRFPL